MVINMEENVLYKKLIEKLQSYHPSKEFNMVEKAYNIAVSAHKGAKRLSGEPYSTHPLCVALILADLEMDQETITAGLLHDVVEDTEYTEDDIARMFSDEILVLVDGVTKLGGIKIVSKEEIQAENFRKMFLAMAKDIRVIIIKLADRLHNMRTLDYMSAAKQIEKAQETLDIYAPLAHRLGIYKLSTELEDLAFSYLQPDVFNDLAEKIQKKQSDREEYIISIVNEIKGALEKEHINCNVEGRPKHFFSIYKKMKSQGKTLDQIYDLFALRILVSNIKECYEVLGVLHVMYKPMPGRFKDYIAMPKDNMYQSVHNTLIGSDGEPFEVQIRTYEMHRTAEYGIAAHWRYKSAQDSDIDKKLTWLRQILEWQLDMTDNKEFMNAVRIDLDAFNDQVYAFSPQGEVITLPRGSTPIDFAYLIHSAVGNKMVGARVNHKIVTFDYEIKNGDRVEIITSQNSKGPSRDWLKTVKSSQARNKINQWFKKEYKEENILKGKELLEKEAKKKGHILSDLTRTQWVSFVLEKYGFNNWDALCASIGHGGLKEGQVINRLYEEYSKEQKENEFADIINKEDSHEEKLIQKKTTGGVVIKGLGNTHVRLSKCCNPVPGDEIIGFITRGRGVSIHRTDCVNIVYISEEDRNRLIETEWSIVNKESVTFLAGLKIICDDRMGIIVDISKVLTNEGITVKSFNARSTKTGEAIFDVIIEIENKKQIEKLSRRIRNLPGVYDIQRVTT